MLLANYLVAHRLLLTTGPAAVLRCHPPIQADRCGPVLALATSLGFPDFRVDSAGGIHNSLLAAYAADPEVGKVLEYLVTKPMRPAAYFAAGPKAAGSGSGGAGLGAGSGGGRGGARGGRGGRGGGRGNGGRGGGRGGGGRNDGGAAEATTAVASSAAAAGGSLPADAAAAVAALDWAATLTPQQLGEFAHYALAIPVYTHFTSPIRRYADVMVHRLLAASLEAEEALAAPSAAAATGAGGRPSAAGAAAGARAGSSSAAAPGPRRFPVDHAYTVRFASADAAPHARQLVALPEPEVAALAAQCEVCNEKKALAKEAQVREGRRWDMLSQQALLLLSQPALLLLSQPALLLLSRPALLLLSRPALLLLSRPALPLLSRPALPLLSRPALPLLSRPALLLQPLAGGCGAGASIASLLYSWCFNLHASNPQLSAPLSLIILPSTTPLRLPLSLHPPLPTAPLSHRRTPPTSCTCASTSCARAHSCVRASCWRWAETSSSPSSSQRWTWSGRCTMTAAGSWRRTTLAGAARVRAAEGMGAQPPLQKRTKRARETAAPPMLAALPAPALALRAAWWHTSWVCRPHRLLLLAAQRRLCFRRTVSRPGRLPQAKRQRLAAGSLVRRVRVQAACQAWHT